MGQIVSAFPTVIVSAAKGTNNIIKAPLLGSVSSVDLFLGVGVILIAVIVWTRILAHIKG